MGEKILTFDVMSLGRFVCTLKMPLTIDLVSEYIDGVVVYDYKKLNKRCVEFAKKKRPSLKYKKFEICL